MIFSWHRRLWSRKCLRATALNEEYYNYKNKLKTGEKEKLNDTFREGDAGTSRRPTDVACAHGKSISGPGVKFPVNSLLCVYGSNV